MTHDVARARMVAEHLEARGITQRRVLDAFRRVPREAFIADELATHAYDDTPLPIGEAQTISQPYIVAVTVEALQLSGNERVLEVGTGSGYAAAILAELASEVYGIERIGTLALDARERLARLGYRNVQVFEGDGSLGLPEHAPYDAIAVAASAPQLPRALLEQLAPGGRLVIPLSADAGRSRRPRQVLTRFTHTGADSYQEEKLTGVRFVPLVGAQGHSSAQHELELPALRRHQHGTSALISESAEPTAPSSTGLGAAAIDALIERGGDSRVVLLGEATHGTSEFYRTRATITRALIEKKGFDFVAIEADWPDAALINDHVLGPPRRAALSFEPFTRFPTWMWRNQETNQFVEWLRAYNRRPRPGHGSVGFYGLDLYSMFTSIAAVLAYLDRVDPALAAVARERYAKLLPWHEDPAAYGQAVLVGASSSSEDAVVSLMRDLLERRLVYSQHDGARFFDAARNARLVANAERYYRAAYHGGADSWNLRDAHMFDTLEALLEYHGPESRGVIWEHNSHVGDATATEMGSRGELNVGQLCRARFDQHAYIVGFGTHHGSVAAAPSWGAPMRRMTLRAAHRDSYEHLCHETERPAFVLHLRDPEREALRDELLSPRLERAVGVVYRPDTELASHYFSASLPLQFDEYIWFDETRAVEPLVPPAELATRGLPGLLPLGP